MSTTYTPRKNIEQWQALVEQWQQSGQSAKQFCREHHLGYASFCQWRKRLSQAGEPATDSELASARPSFIDLSTIGPTPPHGWHIVLSLGNGVELALSQR